MIHAANIPAELRALPQWVLWRTVVRKDQPTKVPFQTNGELAKADDATTWGAFDSVLAKVAEYDGIGFEFAANGGYCGIDLDGCRNPTTGEVADWAKRVILELDTYAEVSPSQTGVKLWIRGKSPFTTGRKREVSAPKVCDKTPAIEVYDHGRYFAVTGMVLRGPTEPQERTSQLAAVCKRLFPPPPPVKPTDVSDRARRYLSKVPPAISGQGGHNATFRVACILILGFGLAEHEALQVMASWNATCVPPWSEKELWHKIKDANKQPGERNYLRFVEPEKWDAVEIPTYAAPPPAVVPKSEPRVTTLMQATEAYLDRLKSGKIDLIELGLGSVDQALAGGVERGELVILAARSSHGKSAVALQIIHNWTAQQRPCAMVSEEMSAMALGKRALQYASDVPQEYWFKSHRELERHAVDHFASRAPCYIIESCRSADMAAEKIRWAVKEKEVQCAVVDYAQLLTGQGKTRYEQVTNTSIVMRQLASEQNIVVLLLCQLNSEVERRKGGFRPVLSDIKDSGQFGQDADVIMFLCWPHRFDSRNNPRDYQFFFAKNRNRGINTPVVTCQFEPSRQRFIEQRPQDRPNYESDFDRFNGRDAEDFV